MFGLKYPVFGLKCLKYPVFGLKCLNLTRHFRVETIKITTLVGAKAKTAGTSFGYTHASCFRPCFMLPNAINSHIKPLCLTWETKRSTYGTGAESNLAARFSTGRN